MKHSLYWLSLSLTIFVLTGCEGYTYTFNQQPIFSPETLFSDFNIKDTALKSCVEQAIFDQNVTKSTQLTHLNCSNAGISKLAGLEIFTGLTHLNLNGNHLTEIKPLLFLSHIQVILLGANKHLLCSDAQLLANNMSGSIKLPTHCSK
ncbi:MAG: hypothetical protein COA46_06220 [Porticoccaceae bacterium]|nr:MAG: hypothetical protein COA46_06220 [Porticoccaceae bacterium]